jgi:hypothetical protein
MDWWLWAKLFGRYQWWALGVGAFIVSCFDRRLFFTVVPILLVAFAAWYIAKH